MSRIGIGVGLAFAVPALNLELGNVGNPSPPTEEEQISDAILLENGSVTLTEDDKYIKSEGDVSSNEESNYANNKSYWNF